MDEFFVTKFGAMIGLLGLIGSITPSRPVHSKSRSNGGWGTYTYPKGYHAKKRKLRKIAKASKRRNRVQ
jgi:hypothetical protein